MISETLELYTEGGRVSDSCSMCVVSHGYGGLSEGRDVRGGWYACGIEPGWLVACREMPEHFPFAR